MHPSVEPLTSVPRGVAVGSVCGVGAVVAHALAAGGSIDPMVAVTVLGVSLLVGPALVRGSGPTRIGALGAGTLVAQLAAHAAMATATPMAPHGSMSGHASHEMGHAQGPTATHADMLLSGGTPMLLLHLSAALLTVLVARGADRAILATLRSWVLPTPPRLRPTVGWPTPPTIESVVVTPTAAPARKPAAPRGPPRCTPYAALVS